MPVRKILRSYRTVTGIRFNKTTGEVSEFESMLERDYMLILTFSRCVESFEVQPVTIDYKNGNKLGSYTPDFLVTRFANSVNEQPTTELIEIKYTEDLISEHEKFEPKFQAAEEFCTDKGWTFKVITEKEIRNDYLLNIKFLIRYQDNLQDTPIQNHLLSTLKELRQSTPKELLTACFQNDTEKSQGLSQLWNLVSHRKIETDLTSRLDMKSAIWLCDNYKGTDSNA